MKRTVAAYAAAKGDIAAGESEAVVVREALSEYFAKRKIPVDDRPRVRVMHETLSPKQTAKYSQPQRRSKAKKKEQSSK